MNLRHHLRVRLQAFASYCMTRAGIKEMQKEDKKNEEKESHNHPNITGEPSFHRQKKCVKPEEHAHSLHQRQQTHIDTKLAGEQR